MKFFQTLEKIYKNKNIFVYLILAILLANPFQYFFGSLATVVFIVFSIPYFFKNKINFTIASFLPIFYFLLMILSVSWSIDPATSIAGLQKQLPLMLIPLGFMYIPKFSSDQKSLLFRYYSFGMVIFCVFFLVKALIRFVSIKNTTVFFYHELVSEDLNAIYFSVFVSFALFYFISEAKSNLVHQIAIGILSVFIFLLSSKSIITIDLLLVFCYYTFFSKTPKSVRLLTVSVMTLFLGMSLVFVTKVKQRFLVEYETAFVDNTVNKNIGTTKDKVYNVSLSQAWTMKKFEPNHYFPGTALRVYQTRIFLELLLEETILLTGFGLDASQPKIAQKAKEHNLYNGYSIFNYHNQYLQTFSDLGLFGFILLIAMKFMNLRNAIKDNNFIHLVFAITMIILFFTESLFCRQRGILFFITLYCIFNIFRGPQKIANHK